MSGNLAAALAHAAAGRAIFPCRQDKSPAISRASGGRGFHDATTDPTQIAAWWAQYPHALIGFPTGCTSGVFVLDVDVRDDKGGEESLAALERQHGALPDTVEALTPSGGRHLYFRHPGKRWKIVNRAEKLGPGLDVRGDGGYVILPPSTLANGHRYSWEGSSDPDEGVRAAPSPDWLLSLVAVDLSAQPAPPSAAARRSATEAADAQSALAVLDPDCAYDDWLTIGMALHATGAEWAFELWDTWSAGGEKYPRDGSRALAAKWKSFDGSGGIGPGTLFALAKAKGWQQPRPTVRRSEGARPPDPPDEIDARGGEAPRRQIRLVGGELPAAVDEAEQALIESGAEIFVHGTRLVRVGRWHNSVRERQISRRPSAAVLIEVGPHWLVEKLTSCADWMRFDKRSENWIRKDAPRGVADTLLARQGEWSFPQLAGFCESPTLSPNGRIVSRRGYDAHTGLYLTDDLGMRPFTASGVSHEEAKRSCNQLLDLVDTFPFVSSADLTAALALMMTGVLRRVLPAAPIGGITASTPGTGKSLLASCISMIATGREPSVMGMGADAAETEKRIDAALLDSDPLVLIDNISFAVRSDVLCQVATQPAKTCRVLGYSRKIEAPTNVQFLLTGNNLTILGDLTRRTLMVALDAGTERPQERVFPRSESEQVDMVRSNRAEAVRAVLAISLAYHQAGCPAVHAHPYGSFGDWDRMVRFPLIWAGLPDPLQSSRHLLDDDHEWTAVRELLRVWWAKFGSQPMKAADVHRAAKATERGFDGLPTPVNPELADAMEAVLGSSAKGGGVRELGYKLRAWNARIVDGYRVVRCKGDRDGVRWRVEQVTGEPVA